MIAKAAPTMSFGSPGKDLGPEVTERFPNWPQRQWRDIAEYDKRGEWMPHELLVYKESDEWCQVKLRVLTWDWGAEELNQALDYLFAPKDPKDRRANTQLGAAKEKGASKTILLLDCPGGAGPDGVVRDYTKLLDPAVVCNIDCIYLAGSGDKEFSIVL